MSNKILFLKSTFPRAPFNLGIGRYVCQLQRVTLKFCKSHGTSGGMRNFIEQDLCDYVKQNPGIVVYTKPRRHRHPVIVAEYLNGKRQWMNVANYTRDDIVKWMELLRTQIHDSPSVRLRKLWHTEIPSIQGPWTPFTFKDPKLNLAQFPNKELGSAVQPHPTATEKLIELFKAQQLTEKETNNSKDTQEDVKHVQKGYSS